MLKIITILFMAGLFAGCADGKFIKIDEPNTCSTTGWTLTAIHYGDSRIVVIPISEVVKDAEFRFILLPADERTDSIDYKDVTVKVVGKPPHDVWFEEKEGKASAGDGTIRVCMDGPSLAEGDEIYYIVEVENVGKLDPRAKVITRLN
jgi:hypothetical protein